jgi:hypothetical protein
MENINLYDNYSDDEKSSINFIEYTENIFINTNVHKKENKYNYKLIIKEEYDEFNQLIPALISQILENIYLLNLDVISNNKLDKYQKNIFDFIKLVIIDKKTKSKAEAGVEVQFECEAGKNIHFMQNPNKAYFTVLLTAKYKEGLFIKINFLITLRIYFYMSFSNKLVCDFIGFEITYNIKPRYDLNIHSNIEDKNNIEVDLKKELNEGKTCGFIMRFKDNEEVNNVKHILIKIINNTL